MEKSNASQNPENSDWSNDPMKAYTNENLERCTVEFNTFQIAYLHKLLQGTNFRFQKEESVK